MPSPKTPKTPEERKAQTAAANAARRLPPTLRVTKVFKFTLPVDLADEFEGMTKEERDRTVALGIKMGRRHRPRG